MHKKFLYDTEQLYLHDRNHIIHPWIDLGTAKTRDPLIIAEAEGVHVYDTHGQRMIDGIGGMWCVNVGYGRKEMAEAIADQVMRLPYFCPFDFISTPQSIEFGRRLTEYTPGDLKHVFFTTGGSTAVDSALRFVQFYNNFVGRPQKKHIITRDYAYHGSTYLSASVSGKPGDRGHLDFITDSIHHLPVPNPYRRPSGMTEIDFCDLRVADLERKIVELGPENVACFIAEPILASGGVIVPPEGYQRRTLEICRRYDVLYISDEVVTGFGRLGEIFASEPVFDIVPDIIISAKGLTSGYIPLGAFFVSDRLYGQITESAESGAHFSNGFTYSAHPVACAAGIKSLEIIEAEGILDHVRAIGPYFMNRLRRLRDLPIVGDVRGSHFMACIECVADKDAKTPMPEHWDVAKRIIRQTMPRGLLVRPLGHQIILSPPLTITAAHVDEIVETLDVAIRAVTDELVRERLWRDAG